MTLNTSLIERESRKLYLRYLKDPRIPEDLCSEIYLEFIERMNRERTRGKSRISGRGLGQLIKIATKTIIHKNRKQEEKENVLTDIVNRNFSQLWCAEKSEEERLFFGRIAQFLQDWSSRKKNYPRYLRLFLLYHSFHLSPEFVDEMSPFADISPEELKNEVEDLKELIRQKVNRELERKTKSLGTYYFLLIKKQVNWGGLKIQQFDESLEDYDRVKINRAKALEAVRSLKFFPSRAQIHRMTGISERVVCYGCQAVEKAIKDSFKDDSYWG